MSVFDKTSEEIRNLVWVEKYRPTKLEDVLGDDTMLASFRSFIEKGELPTNLLFVSKSPGSGKTSSARIISKCVSDTILHLNASLDRGIDTIRNDVENFCMTQSYDGRVKIVIFEEFDNVTKDAQKALRDLMEDHTDNVRFILTCNYINKVIDPIQSRTAIYKFGDIKPVDILKRMFYILENEGVIYDKKNVANIVKNHGSDIRSMIQTLQRLTIEEDGKKMLRSYMSGKEIFKKLLDLIKDKNLVDVRKLISDNNLDGQEVLKYIFRNIEELSPEHWPEVCYELSEGLYKMVVGVDKEIALTATIVSIMNNL